MIGWSKINLGDLATFHNGYAFKPEDWSTSGKEIIRIQNLTKGSAQINYFQGEIADKYKVRHDDVLISWSGSLGVYIWHGKDAWLNQHLFKVVFNKENLDKSFFIYLISNSLKKLEAQVHGATMKHITKKKFDAFPVNLPPLEQQKKIAAILDAANAYRQKTKALIEKYGELTQSLFMDMFGDPRSNPKGFVKMKIGDAIETGHILKIQDGNHGEIHPKADDFLTEGTPMIFANNLRDNKLDYKGGHHLSDQVVKNLRIGFSKGGDVLLTHKGSVGMSDVVPNSLSLLILSPQVTYYRVNTSNLNPFFLKFFFVSKYFFNQLEKLGKQSTRTYVGITKQKLLPLIIPEIGLQNKFAERVQAIEAQKAQAEASLAQAEDLFNSLLQRAFKGELIA